MGSAIFDGDVMDATICLKGAIPDDLTQQMRAKAEETLHQVHADYFPQKSFEDFQKGHMTHALPGVIPKIMSYRFFNSELVTSLRECLKDKVATAHNSEEASQLLFHPIFYLRFSWPNIYLSKNPTEPFMDSQPHYDIGFGLPAYVFWVPLVEINEDTGGLCYWKGEKVFELFPSPTNKNTYSYETYLEAAPTIDGDLRRDVVSHELEVGDVLTFDGTLLHGAIRPQKSVRISIDFRFVLPSKVRGCSETVQQMFKEVNESFDLTRAQNLMSIGDFLGAARILEHLSQKTNNIMLSKVAEVMKACPPQPEILKESSCYHWSNEYRWISKGEGVTY